MKKAFSLFSQKLVFTVSFLIVIGSENLMIVTFLWIIKMHLNHDFVIYSYGDIIKIVFRKSAKTQTASIYVMNYPLNLVFGYNQHAVSSVICKRVLEFIDNKMCGFNLCSIMSPLQWLQQHLNEDNSVEIQTFSAIKV